MRFADDFIVGFEHRDAAGRFLAALRDRVAKFGLELHPGKTRLIESGRHAARNRAARGEGKPETFAFLGFTHICATSRSGRFWIRRKTDPKRMRAKLMTVKDQLRQRRYLPLPGQGKWLAGSSRPQGWEMQMFVATVVLSGLLAFAFGAGAAGKLTKARSELGKASKLKIPWRRYRLIALPEAAAAVGLLAGLGLAPLGIAAAAGLVALMGGALTFRTRVHDAIPFLLGDAALLVLAAVTATLRALTA